LPPAKDRAVGKQSLCRLLLKAVGKVFFADCPIILAGGKEKQSAKTSFADCLACGKEKLVAKMAVWQVGFLFKKKPAFSFASVVFYALALCRSLGF
jgi:hypothetical protein